MSASASAAKYKVQGVTSDAHPNTPHTANGWTNPPGGAASEMRSPSAATLAITPPTNANEATASPPTANNNNNNTEPASVATLRKTSSALLETPNMRTGHRSLQVNVDSESMSGSSANLLLTPNRGSLVKLGAASKVNKSKLMALTGEALPTNALDPTGYERHEEDAKAKAEKSDEMDADIQDGLAVLDQYGNLVYKSRGARVKGFIRKRARGCWKVRDPASPNRQYWSFIVVSALLYGMIEIPIRVGFDMDAEPWSAPDIFNLFVDIFFLCDVFVNFRTGFYQEDNRLVLDERKIAYRYLKSWFLLDIITSIPISHIMQAALEGSASGMALISLPRLLRIFRIARLFKILRMLKLMTMMSNWSESTNEKIFSLLLKVMKFVVLVFLLSHLSGCIWGFIAFQQKDGEGNFHHLSWPYRYGIYNYDADTTFSHMYLLSVYWALCTLTTLGYGDIHAGSSYEYAFCIVLTFVGTCLFGYIIGTISSIIKHGKETETLYLSKMMELNLYMSYRKITPFLQKKVRKHYEYLWKRQTLYNEADILNELPNYIKSDLSLYLYKDLIEKVPFLADMGPDSSMLVILKLKPLQFAPGEYVFTKGALGREMFFISKGTVEVINGSGYIICQLKEGSYVGEYSILSEKPVYRTASVRARTFVDMLSLSKNDFEMIWSLYPEIYAKIILRAKQQWQKAIQDNQNEMAETSTNKGDLTAAKLAKAASASATAASTTKLTTDGGKPPAIASQKTLKRVASIDAGVPDIGGDAVIRIEKADGVGSERKLIRESANNLNSSSPDTPCGDDDGGAGVGGGDADEDADTDYDDADDLDDEPSYQDSLEGMDSENDEDYDVRQDFIDLPDHLMPPPKPRIIGSLITPEVEAAEAAAKDAKDKGKSTKGTIGTGVTSGAGSLNTADGDGAALKDLLRRSVRHSSSGRLVSPMMEEAVLSPAEERQIARRKSTLNEQYAYEAAMAEAARQQQAQNNDSQSNTPTLASMPGSAPHKAGLLSPTRDGANRGSLFSSMMSQSTTLPLPPAPITAPHDNDISTIREDVADDDQDEDDAAAAKSNGANAGSGVVSGAITSDDITRVKFLKRQHQKRMASGEKSDAMPIATITPTGTAGTDAVEPPSSASPPPSPLVISTYSTPHSMLAAKPDSLLAGGVAAATARLDLTLEQQQPQQQQLRDPHSSSIDLLNFPPLPLSVLSSGVLPVPVVDGPGHALIDRMSASDLTTSPQFWSSLQSILTTAVEPMKMNYHALMLEHTALQQKQQRTEQLVRSLVAKLKVERAMHAAAAEHRHTASSGASGTGSGNNTDTDHTSPLLVGDDRKVSMQSDSPKSQVTRLDSLSVAPASSGFARMRSSISIKRGEAGNNHTPETELANIERNGGTNGATQAQR